MKSGTNVYKKMNSPLRREAEEQVSGTMWCLAACVALFLLFAPFQRALFNQFRYEFKPYESLSYHRPIFTAMILAFIALVLCAVILLFKRTAERSNVPMLAVWLIPLMYGLAAIQGVSTHFSRHSLYLELMYAAFFVFGVLLARQRQTRGFLVACMMISGYAVVLHGLGSWFAQIGSPGAVVDAPDGLRLAAAFTYANSYAAFLLALLFGGAYLAVTAASRTVRFAHAAMLVPVFLSLLLTFSRGGLVLIPVLALLLLPLLRLPSQLLFLAQLLFASLVALGITNRIVAIGTELHQGAGAGLAWTGWAFIAGAACLSGVLALVLKRWASSPLEAFAERRKLASKPLLIPGALAVLGILGVLAIQIPSVLALFPDSIEGRLRAITFTQHSVQERGYFYIDSMKLVMDYPVLGTGGGGWTTLYHAYKSYPYSSREAHNFYLQTMIEIGLLGAAVLFAFIAWIYWRYIRHYVRSASFREGNHVLFAIVAGSILVHSAIDFDMSYAYLSALVFLCLGGMTSSAEGETPRKAADPDPAAPSGQASRSSWPGALKRYGMPALLLVIAIPMLVVSFRLHTANAQMHQAYAKLSENEIDLDEVGQMIEQALKLHPSNIDFTLLYVDLLNAAYAQTNNAQYREQAEALLDKLEQRETHVREVSEYRYAWGAANQRWDDAIAITSKALQHTPWEIQLYDRLASLHQTAAQADESNRGRHEDAILQLYAEVQERRRQIDEIPDSIMISTPFDVSPELALIAGQTMFARGSYSEASEALKPMLNDDLGKAQNRMIARWYLASLSKLGQSDQAWFDKLTAAAPEERELVQQLAEQAVKQ